MITQRAIDAAMEPSRRELEVADCGQVRIESDISGLEALWKQALSPGASPFSDFCLERGLVSALAGSLRRAVASRC